MSSKVTSRFKIHNALQFKEQFNEADPSHIYFFIGKSTPWPSDENPPSANDTVSTIDYRTWDDILSMKKLQPSDVTFAVPRYDWSPSTVYQMYRFDADITQDRFYVVTDEFHVYKCLYNNKGAPSTVKPTGTLTTAFQTADGYIWKYMYSISPGDALKFVTANYIPVKTLPTDDGSSQWAVQQAAVPGDIQVIEVTNGGANYRANSGTAQTGDATSITLATSASSVGGFYVGCDVYISLGTGAGQIRRIVGYNGTTKVAFVSPSWSTPPDNTSVYTVAPAVVITGDGADYKGISVVSNNSIQAVTTLDPGHNYTFADVVFSGNGGSGAMATAHIAPLTGHGADPVSELYGYNIMLNVRLSGREANNFMVGNEFRQIGIMLDPIVDSSNTVGTASVYNQTTLLKFTGESGTFINDELVTGLTSGATGYVVEYSQADEISLVNVSGTFQTSELISGSNSSVTATVTQVTPPPIRKYSGKILYLENRTPITRNPTQAEDFKTIIKFS